MLRQLPNLRRIKNAPYEVYETFDKHRANGEFALRAVHALDARFREDDGRECVAAHRLIDGY